MTAILPVLLCGGAMVVCFLLMSRMHGRGSEAPGQHAESAPTDDIVALREEVAELRGELRTRDEHERQPARPNDRG